MFYWYIIIILSIVILGLAFWVVGLKNNLQKIEAQTFESINLPSSENPQVNDSYLSKFIQCNDVNAEFSLENFTKPSEKTNLELDFLGDKMIQGFSTLTILENSLEAGIDHKFECGGNARCSTCRVLVTDGLKNCLPRNSAETELAKKKSLSDEVRLACQTYSIGDLKLKRLVLDEEDIEEAVGEGQKFHSAPGKEMKLAILFCDIRSFTSFSEKNYPYDVVHILNRYFNSIGKSIDQNFGYIDKYMGDGIMVLFGLDSNREIDPCEDAICAGIGILESLEKVNSYLKKNFDTEFKIGIGVHYGSVIVGEVGFKLKMQFTALGDSVNMASRIEGVTKKAGVDFLISDEVFDRVRDHENFQFGKKFKTGLKGKSGNYLLHEIIATRSKV